MTTGEIWHYTTAAGLTGILSEHVLWASSAAFMNDHQELRTGPAVLARQFQDLYGSVDEGFRLLAEGTGTVDPTLSFVACACDDGDSLTMWRNYTGGEVGFAVRLDPERPLHLRRQRSIEDAIFPADHKLLANENYSLAATLSLLGKALENFDGNPIDWQDAIYNKEQQDALARQYLARVRSYVADPGLQTNDGAEEISDVMLNFDRQLQMFKDEAFKDEQEKRIVCALQQPLSRCFVKFRTGKYGIVPYVELGVPVEEPEVADSALPRPMQNLPIMEIAVGPTPYPEAAVQGVTQLLMSSGYGYLDVIPSKIPFR